MQFQPSHYSSSTALVNASGGVSHNGWPASTSPSEIGIVKVNLATGHSFQATEKAAEALKEMAEWFDSNVQPIQTIYGYNYRTIAGTSTISNHGSGTAIDINGCGVGGSCPLPYMERNIPTSKYPAITAKAASLGLRWGGTYISNPDEMHFEVNESITEMAKRVIVTGVKTGMIITAASILTGGVVVLGLAAVYKIKKRARKRRES
jgi:hypothetical protein